MVPERDDNMLFTHHVLCVQVWSTMHIGVGSHSSLQTFYS